MRGTWEQMVRAVAACGAILMILGSPLPVARGDSVTMKTGVVYRGTVDRDNTIISIFDGLRRVVVRDSKITKIESDDPFQNHERFRLIQPMSKHGGVMPHDVLAVEAEPWNDRGRRWFRYLTVSVRTGKPVRIEMQQAINELGPRLVRLRGVDGFWLGQLALSQVPREVVLGLLAKVDQANQNERLRVARFLIQAEWYSEARAALEALIRDFPDLKETVSRVQELVAKLEAEQLRREIDTRRQALQPKEVLSRLRAFPTKDVAADVLQAVRKELQEAEAQAAADVKLAESLRALAEKLPEPVRKSWQKPLTEILKALDEAPDAVRDRLTTWQEAEKSGSGSLLPETRFALALSGYAVGADAAVSNLKDAETLWKARDLVQSFLASPNSNDRRPLIESIQAVEWPVVEAGSAEESPTRPLDLVTRLARCLPPPLAGDKASASAAPGKVATHRVREDSNPEPTEYRVLLPPEYHPLRSYPAVIALHGGQGPQHALDWWSAEAARRGYIVVAPEYNLVGELKDYRYSPSEHAAVVLALRDARRRYAIDSNRVFLGGQLLGGQMAWDVGLTHPDLFAGVAVVSGQPAKYVLKSLNQAELVPCYFVMGDLAPAAVDVIYSSIIKPLIVKAYDVTYVEYYRRGLEDLPEEAPAIFDWMDHRRRDPYPRSFDIATARTCDDRYYGVVVREFSEGRTMTPEVVDNFGKNLNPATISMKTNRPTNRIEVTVNGIQSLDIWLSPEVLDFHKPMKVRVNRRSFVVDLHKRPDVRVGARPGKRARPADRKPASTEEKPPLVDLEPLLEDLRVRGDRQQVYWMKIQAG
jgi:pimeloyl-ACP methyl ester carboxylesterase